MSQNLTYEEFGRRFFEVAVTEDRIGAAFAAITGGAFEVGPIPSGPGGLAKVRARVRIAEPQITRNVGELITFEVAIPLRIGLLVDLRLDRVKYDVDGLVTLPLTARAVEPLELRIEVEPPRPQDVVVGVASRNLRGEIVRMVGQVDDEIKRFVARHVAEEIDKPEVRKARIIDVAAELGRAFEAM
ncbi:hypothetical protein QSJ18_04220 [Gordonia sp. ABSL1-1]|uniref:hypothetical protein n=1 Tax=Gordonia sp. ABSL1-1 TaxID=3053923 RepID=UPI00257339B7|nr:hypothetical protein [Gordonia sp. ABSL1-1]MDL9935944.1 hypothetical protein [Gordonia sp. ABSL1-1]